MGAIDILKERHQRDYSDMSFDEFLRKTHQKFYPDMSFDDYMSRLGGPTHPYYDPVSPKNTGEPIGLSEQLTGVSPTKDISGLYPSIGGAVGGIVGGVPGASVGGAIGEAGRQYVEGKPISPGGIAKEGAIQGGLEGLGWLAQKGLSGVLAPAAGKMSGETKEAAEYFRRFGGDISPGQATESKLLDLAEGVSEASMTGGPRMFKFREKQAEAFGAVAKDLVDKVGTQMGDHEIGVLFADAIQGSDKAFRAQAAAFYKNVDSLTTGASVDLTPLKNFAQEVSVVAKERAGIGGSAAGDMLLKRVNQLSDTVSFEEAAAIRSGLIDEVSSFAGKRDKAEGIAKKFLSLTHDAMENSAKTLGDEAHAAWVKAREFYKEGKQTFQNDFIKGLVGYVENNKKGAEAIAGEIFKPGKETAIRAVKSALREKPEVWKELRGAYLDDIIRKSTTVDGVILGKSFLKQLDNMGEKTLSEIFTKQEINDIRTVAKIGRLTQARPVGGGSMLIQLTQAGAIIGLVSGQFPKSSATVLLGPAALARILTNPKGIRWLTEGLKTPAGVDKAVSLAGRIITESIRSGNAEDIQINPY